MRFPALLQLARKHYSNRRATTKKGAFPSMSGAKGQQPVLFPTMEVGQTTGCQGTDRSGLRGAGNQGRSPEAACHLVRAANRRCRGGPGRCASPGGETCRHADSPDQAVAAQWERRSPPGGNDVSATRHPSQIREVNLEDGERRSTMLPLIPPPK